jgi:hypothetical protein
MTIADDAKRDFPISSTTTSAVALTRRTRCVRIWRTSKPRCCAGIPFTLSSMGVRCARSRAKDRRCSLVPTLHAQGSRFRQKRNRTVRCHSGRSADGQGCPPGDSPRTIVFVLLPHANVPVRPFSVMQSGNVKFRSLFRTGRLRCAHCFPALNLGLHARVKTQAHLDGVSHAIEDVRVSSAHLQRVASAFTG